MSVRNIVMVISLALSVVIGLVLARGRSEGSHAGGGKVLIGLSLDTQKEARWITDKDEFVARCKELGADVNVTIADSNDLQQAKDVESLITGGAQVLVVVAHDGRAMGKAVEMGHAAGLPVIAYDRMITESDVDLYMSFDNVRVGEQQAKFMVDHLPGGKGKIVRIYGSRADNNAVLFKEGQDKVLKPYIDRGDIVVIHEDWADDWKPENGKKIMNAAISKYKHDFQGVLASNDGTAGGAIQALLEEGLQGKVLVTGQDAELAACQRIVSGSQSMSIYKPIKRMARTAADTAVAWAKHKPIIAPDAVPNGKKDVPSILVDTVTVTKENMMETVIKDGFQKYELVYQGVPEAERPKLK